MFGQNKSPRRCVSQTISKQRRGFYFWAIFVLTTPLSYAQTTYNAAQTGREIRDQIPRDRGQGMTHGQEYYPPKPKEGDFNDFLKNLHGSYGVTLMGPRFIGASNETYNIYIPDIAPIQLFHSWQLGFQASNDLQIGIKGAVVQNIANDVVGETGFVRGRSWENYDPAIFFDLPNLINVQGWSVSTSASFSISLTQYSQNQGRVTQIVFDQTWWVNTFPSNWSYGFSYQLNPQFYTDPPPDGILSRKTLYASIGHRLNYSVSNNFQIQTSTNFDVGHSTLQSGFFELNDGLEDTFKIAAAVMPNIAPAWVTISGYVQTLFWNPSIDTTILGFDFSIGF